MIKKTFKDFILLLETEDSHFMSKSSSKDFLNSFDAAIYDLRIEGVWWSKIAKKNTKWDSEMIWNDINQALNAHGLTWEDVKAHKDEILQRVGEYCSMCAPVDIMLYNLDNRYKVGGWDESITKDVEETFIKYRYGYHETGYGRIFINSYWGSIEDFIESVAKNILEGFIHDSSFVDFSDIEEVKSDMREEGDLVQYEDGKAIVYLENFYYTIKHYLKRKTDYEKFKSFFLNWLEQMISYDNIEDKDMYLVIDFSEQL
jgi:hypothetical protein